MNHSTIEEQHIIDELILARVLLFDKEIATSVESL